MCPRPDLDAAAVAAHQTLAYLPDVGSTRLLHSLREVATVLHGHRATPQVADYLDAYRTVISA